ncbi:hypothetical protein Tco_1441908, partial [Tanacetum coccineum]
MIPTETPIIAPTIPPSPDYTPASDTESNPSEDPSSDHIPPLPATSPFLSSTDDSSDSDIPDTPPSPTHDTPFTETTFSTQRSPVIPFLPRDPYPATPVITLPTTQTDTTMIPTETPIIAPNIPSSLDYTPASDIESDPSKDPSSDHIPPLPAISPFLSSTDDSSNSDIPDTLPLPTHDTPFTETPFPTQRSPITPRRRVMILAPGQPIPYGRPYRYHPNRPVHMMNARKRVGSLPTHRLAVRHSFDHSLSDYFSPDDS